MAFLQKHLGRMSAHKNDHAPAMWGYKTADAHAAVDSVGYFGAVYRDLKIGDLIYVAVVTNLGLANEALATAGLHVVNANASAAAVDIADVLALTVTDTD